MAYIILYRKPAYQKIYPWTEYCADLKTAAEFIMSLNEEYDFRAFEEISGSDFMRMIEEMEVEA